ncbi:MAG TPA: AAA family ATPase [Bryobacteraceae bacterium]|nr:AAA family ATPase [Bryobacteraceae bacterium]
MSAGVQQPTYEMASVLFMDIVGYSLRSIDDQTELLTALQTTVRASSEYQQASEKHELISLPTGDGMALVFLRNPISPVQCALEIAAALKGQPEIRLRLGIHQGPVRRHADIREEVNVVGGGINMAQRVMDCGDAGHILLSRNVAEVLEQLRGWSDCLQDLGVHEVKHGVKLQLYNLCKEGLGNPALPQKISKFPPVPKQGLASDPELAELTLAVRGHTLSALSRAAEREPASLVGREPEMQRLEAILARGIAGSGKVVLLRGEPGIGKSALARSALHAVQCRHPDLLVGHGACIEQHGTGEAYLPFLEALGGLLAGPGRERVIILLRRHAPTWCLQFPSVFSGALLDTLQREAIGSTKERMLRELGDALGEMAAVFPLILFIEDLQWSDPSSIDLIRHLGLRAKAQRLLLLGTARWEGLEQSHQLLQNCKRELQTQAACEEIVLEGLQRNHICRYLNDYFSPNTFPLELAALIYHKTEGHPLFATGILQLLAEREDVVKNDGVWNLKRPVSEMDLDVPEGVRSMILKKIEVLEEQDRGALQYASVQGEEFLSTALAALLESDELALEERLDRLERAHHLIQTVGEEELPEGGLATRYRFAHALYQNTFYSGLSSKRRALLHRQVGEILVRSYGSQASRIATSLATHFERGRDFPRAVDYFTRSGDNAAILCAHAQAVDHYSHALELVGKLPAELQFPHRMTLYKKRGDAYLSQRQLQEAASDCVTMRNVAQAAGNVEWECLALNALGIVHNYGRQADEMGSCAKLALELAESIGDRALWSEAMALRANSRMVVGSVAEAHALFDQAIPAARAVGHSPALLQGLTYRGVAHFFQTNYAEAAAAETEASELAVESHDGFYLSLSLFYLGLSRANQGHISGALTALNEALDLATRNFNQIALSRVPNGIGWVYREIGDLGRAIEYNVACVETARRTHAVEAESNALINLVYDYSLAGEPQKALDAMQSVDPLFDREDWNRWRFFDIRHQAASAEYWLGHRNLDRAEEHARRLLTNAERYGVPKYIATARRLLGEIAAALSDTNTAEEELRRSLEPFAKNPAPLVEWRNQAALGRLLRSCGRPAAAHEAFNRAAEVVKQISAGITDAELRSGFLNAPAVRQVISEGD